MKDKKVLFLVQFSLLTAIEALFCFTVLGSLPIGPIVATLAMIPVIMTALLLGTKAGTAMGFIAGLFSFIVWTFMPPASSAAIAFVFTPFYSLGEMQGNFGSLLICFVPRILVGTFSGLIYHGLRGRIHEYPAMILAAVLGSLTNTIGVMGGIWLFFGTQYSSIAGQSMLALIGVTLLTGGIPEAVVSALVAPAVCRPVQIAISRK